MFGRMGLTLATALVLTSACGGGVTPAAQATPAATPNATAAPTQSAATPIDVPIGTHRSMLLALMGTGTGGVSVTPKAITQGTFDADIKVRVQTARANATYTVQRAPEIGRASAADGVCQRAAGMSPWGPSDPPAPAFVTFMNGTSPYTITTDGAGAGSLDFEFFAPTVPAGTLFDVMFRLVDNLDAPTMEIRSGCFTVTVK